MAFPLSIVENMLALRSGQRTAQQLVQQCFENIQQWEEKIGAWVALDRHRAVEEAKRLDQLLDNGVWAGPLHGIPLGIKDIIDVEGFATVAGSPLRKDSPVATADATIVTRLRKAGAIILGKTVTTELACFDPPNTKNPWNINCTPGGSSSGSAAAVASGMCLAAIGTQTGGSIIRPASYCGVSGLKATFGRVSRNGVVMVSEHLDHVGPIARRVADLALILRVIAGPDPQDSHTTDEPLFEKSVSNEDPPALKFKILNSWIERSSPEVAAVVQASVSKLQTAGAVVENVELPRDFEEILKMHRQIMAVEIYQIHQNDYEQHSDKFGRNVSSLLNEGKSDATEDYQQALEYQQSFKAEMDKLFASDEIWLSPATDTTAPEDLTTTGSPQFNSPWSLSGQPTLAIPCGIAENGLPVSIQLIGRTNQEPGLIKAALWCERVLKFKNVISGK